MAAKKKLIILVSCASVSQHYRAVPQSICSSVCQQVSAETQTKSVFWGIFRQLKFKRRQQQLSAGLVKVIFSSYILTKIYLVLCLTMKYVETRRICSSVSLGCFNLANSKRIMRGNEHTITGAQNIPISPITISENDAMRLSLYRHIHAPHSFSGWLSSADSKAACSC